jgi:hypothetical protein
VNLTLTLMYGHCLVNIILSSVESAFQRKASHWSSRSIMSQLEGQLTLPCRSIIVAEWPNPELLPRDCSGKTRYALTDVHYSWVVAYPETGKNQERPDLDPVKPPGCQSGLGTRIHYCYCRVIVSGAEVLVLNDSSLWRKSIASTLAAASSCMWGRP